MTTRYYRFAGITAALSMPETWFFEEEYRLSAFRSAPAETDWHFYFEKAEILLPPAGTQVCRNSSLLAYADEMHCIRYLGCCDENWETAKIRTAYQGKKVSVQLRKDRFPEKISVRDALNSLGVEHLIARNDGFILHCSYIDHEGKAILFTAPSETGKSTQAELWHNHRAAEIINGDRAAVRLAGDHLLAEGIPFAGSSQYCLNRSLPIAAIVYLSQAPETTIHRLTGFKAFSRIWEGISINTWDREDLDRVSSVVQRIVTEIPIFHLRCTPDLTAVTALEAELRKRGNP